MKCPLCGRGEMVCETRDLEYSYRGRTTSFPQRGEYCTSCNEIIFTTVEAESYISNMREFQSAVDREPLSPSEIKRIRKKLKLTQKEAGDVFGGGIRAFSQYERGLTKHSKALDMLLRLLDTHPELLHEVATQDAA